MSRYDFENQQNLSMIHDELVRANKLKIIQLLTDKRVVITPGVSEKLQQEADILGLRLS